MAKDHSKKTDNTTKETNTARGYWGNSLEGGMFSTATGPNNNLTTIRFSYVVNAGSNYNYIVNNNFGWFTGLNIKNVGFIEKQGDSTVKHRTYNLGVPLGIKIGNVRGHNYFFAGVDLEMPFNYKEKGFVSRGSKRKFNSWFSGRTPTFMPAIFAGISVKPGISFKLEYYLNSFLNPDFTDNGIKPYAGYSNVHLILLSIGMDINYGKKSSKPSGEKLKEL